MVCDRVDEYEAVNQQNSLRQTDLRLADGQQYIHETAGFLAFTPRA